MGQWNSAYVVIFSITGGLSVVGSTALIILFLWKAELRSGPFQKVFWMSLCDLGLSLKFWLAMVTQAPVSMERNQFVCLLSAITGNFFGIATVSWYFVIAICVYSVFQPRDSRWRWVLNNEILQHTYVWGLATFGAFLPWWTNRYGDMDDGTQCWIPGLQDPMKLTMELPLYLYLCFAFYLFFYVFFLSKTTLILNTRLRERMFSFVGLFAIAWIWPALASLWNYIAPGTLPLPLHYLDVAAVSGSGFFNFLVWFTHPAYSSLICSCFINDESRMGTNTTSNLNDISSADPTPTNTPSVVGQEGTINDTTLDSGDNIDLF